MYQGVEGLLYKDTPQVNGSIAHASIDAGSIKQKNVISGIGVYSSRFGMFWKIDKYFTDTKRLVECKRKITTIHIGYVFQLYAQYFGMIEDGYEVDSLWLYSIQDNKKYSVDLPGDDPEVFAAFQATLEEMRRFKLEDFEQGNTQKCRNCIYSNACRWGDDYDG